MPIGSLILAVMMIAPGSVIAPIDVSAMYVLLAGSVLAGFTQLLVRFITSKPNDEETTQSRQRLWANVGIGAVAGFLWGVYFLSLQTAAIPAQTVWMWQMVAGFIGYDALLLLSETLTGIITKIVRAMSGKEPDHD